MFVFQAPEHLVITDILIQFTINLANRDNLVIAGILEHRE
jgi:hypothetical protein